MEYIVNNIKNIQNSVDNVVKWDYPQNSERTVKCENCALTKNAHEITSIWGHNGIETVVCKECLELYFQWLRGRIDNENH